MSKFKELKIKELKLGESLELKIDTKLFSIVENEINKWNTSSNCQYIHALGISISEQTAKEIFKRLESSPIYKYYGYDKNKKRLVIIDAEEYDKFKKELIE